MNPSTGDAEEDGLRQVITGDIPPGGEGKKSLPGAFGGKRLSWLFLGVVALLGVLSLVVIYSTSLAAAPIRSDGEGYYLYLPGLLIHHDITMNTAIRRHFHGTVPVGLGVLPWGESGRYLIKYTMGLAVMIAPFFLAGGAIGLLAGAPLDGYSWPFQYAAAAAGLVYVLAGLGLLWRLLAQRFRPATVALTLTGLVFATNLFHYATYDSVFSHGASFFLFTLFLVLVQRLYALGRLRDFALAGAVAGLIVLTRPTNVCWLIFGLGYGVYSRETLCGRLTFWKRHVPGLALAGLAALAVFAPQMLYWKAVTGSWLVYSYQGEGFNFTEPQLFNVLFSVRKGLFFWSPFLLVALAGLSSLPRKAPEWLLPMALYLPLHVFIVASWHEWAYGGSFGHRAFTETLPLFAFCFAALYERVNRPVWRVGLTLITLLCAMLSVWLMLKYWQRAIPFDWTNWRIFLRALP